MSNPCGDLVLLLQDAEALLTADEQREYRADLSSWLRLLRRTLRQRKRSTAQCRASRHRPAGTRRPPNRRPR